MIKIGILSKNHQQYRALIESKNKTQAHEIAIEIIASNSPQDILNNDCEILLANPKLAAEIVSSLDNLKWLQSCWAGVNSLIYNDKKNYKLTGIKDAFGHKMSEYVFAHLLNFARQPNAYKASQVEKLWTSHETFYLKGKTLGIMGLGNIGEQVAKTAKILGMEVNAVTNRSERPDIGRCFHQKDILDFAKCSDIIVNLLPETHDTIGLCTADFFKAMPIHSIFMNVGRGSVIADDEDLANALACQHLAYAVIDVCKVEPLPQEHPFWLTKNLLLTNHTAAISNVDDVFNIFWENLLRYTGKKSLIHEVDRTKGY